MQEIFDAGISKTPTARGACRGLLAFINTGKAGLAQPIITIA